MVMMVGPTDVSLVHMMLNAVISKTASVQNAFGKIKRSCHSFNLEHFSRRWIFNDILQSKVICDSAIPYFASD